MWHIVKSCIRLSSHTIYFPVVSGLTAWSLYLLYLNILHNILDCKKSFRPYVYKPMHRQIHKPGQHIPFCCFAFFSNWITHVTHYHSIIIALHNIKLCSCNSQQDVEYDMEHQCSMSYFLCFFVFFLLADLTEIGLCKMKIAHCRSIVELQFFTFFFPGHILFPGHAGCATQFFCHAGLTSSLPSLRSLCKKKYGVYMPLAQTHRQTSVLTGGIWMHGGAQLSVVHTN